MNDDIKEILRNCEKAINEASGYNDTTDKLLDYITNLQHTEDLYNQLLKDYDEEVEENIKLTKLWKNEVEKRRKVVEYIENNEVCCLEYIGRNEITGNLEKQIQRDLVNRTDLLNILNGKE